MCRLGRSAGSLWVPLCTTPPSLAKVNLKTGRLVSTYPVVPRLPRADRIWCRKRVAHRHKSGELARIDPGSGTIFRTYKVPRVPTIEIQRRHDWVSHAEGSDLTGMDAMTGKMIATVATGPIQDSYSGGGAI